MMNGKRDWNGLLQWLVPTLLAVLMIVFGLWTATMKTSAVDASLVRSKEWGTSQFYSLGEGRELKARVDGMESRLARIEKKQDEILTILRKQ